MNMKKPNRLIALLCIAAGSLLTQGCGAGIAKEYKIQTNLQQASVLASLGDKEGARKWINAAVAVDPKSLDVYVRPGSADEDLRRSVYAIFENIGDYQTLADYMKEAARKFPGEPEPFLRLAMVQRLMGDLAGSKDSASQAAALIEKKFKTPGVKTDAALSDSLAEAYWLAGDSIKGEDAYRRAIRAYPTDLTAYNGLAYEFADTNMEPKLEEALKLATDALKMAEKDDQLDPGSLAMIQDTVGWVHYRRGEYQDALKMMIEAVDNAPREPEVRYHIAMVYLALKDVESAKAELTHATLLSKDYAAAREELARLTPSQ